MIVYLSKRTRLTTSDSAPLPPLSTLQDVAGAMRMAAANGAINPLPPQTDIYAAITAAGFLPKGTLNAPLNPTIGLSLLSAAGPVGFKVRGAIVTAGLSYNYFPFRLLSSYLPTLELKGGILAIDNTGKFFYSGTNTSSINQAGQVQAIDPNFTYQNEEDNNEYQVIASSSILVPNMQNVLTVSGNVNLKNSTPPVGAVYPSGTISAVVDNQAFINELYIIEVDDSIDQAAVQAGTPLYWVTNVAPNSYVRATGIDPIQMGAVNTSAPAVRDIIYVQNNVNGEQPMGQGPLAINDEAGVPFNNSANAFVTLGLATTQNLFNKTV